MTPVAKDRLLKTALTTLAIGLMSTLIMAAASRYDLSKEDVLNHERDVSVIQSDLRNIRTIDSVRMTEIRRLLLEIRDRRP